MSKSYLEAREVVQCVRWCGHLIDGFDHLTYTIGVNFLEVDKSVDINMYKFFKGWYHDAKRTPLKPMPLLDWYREELAEVTSAKLDQTAYVFNEDNLIEYLMELGDLSFVGLHLNTAMADCIRKSVLIDCLNHHQLPLNGGYMTRKFPDVMLFIYIVLYINQAKIQANRLDRHGAGVIAAREMIDSFFIKSSIF